MTISDSHRIFEVLCLAAFQRLEIGLSTGDLRINLLFLAWAKAQIVRRHILGFFLLLLLALGNLQRIRIVVVVANTRLDILQEMAGSALGNSIEPVLAAGVTVPRGRLFVGVLCVSRLVVEEVCFSRRRSDGRLLPGEFQTGELALTALVSLESRCVRTWHQVQ